MREPGQRRVFKTKTSKPSSEVLLLLVAQPQNTQGRGVQWLRLGLALPCGKKSGSLGWAAPSKPWRQDMGQTKLLSSVDLLWVFLRTCEASFSPLTFQLLICQNLFAFHKNSTSLPLIFLDNHPPPTFFWVNFCSVYSLIHWFSKQIFIEHLLVSGFVLGADLLQ